MSDLEQRLAGCLLTVFPDLSPEQFSDASTLTVKAWDSVATLTLLMLIEEEFGVPTDYDKVEELVSYRNILSYLGARMS